MRFGLNLLLSFSAIAAGIGASILRDIRSERYYVHDTLTLNNWDVTKLTEEELGEIFDLNEESFYVGNTIDGVSYALKFFGVEFSTETARRNHGVVGRKVDRMIRDLLQLHDLVADSAGISVYASDSITPPHTKNREIIRNQFKPYPPKIDKSGIESLLGSF